MTRTATLSHLRDLVRSVTEPDLTEAVRASRARTVAEAAADLADVARFASTVIGGSQALDMLATTRGRNDRDAGDRITARRIADQLRAAYQTISDTPGLDPRPLDTGTGTTGIGEGLPLIRTFALERDFNAGGSSPVVPGVAGGNIDGLVDPAVPIAPGAAVTIDDVGAGGARHLAVAIAQIARQVRDFTTDAGNQLLDQILTDIADRAAEKFIGTELVAGAGGTRVAGADLTTLGAALDAAEAAAGAALEAPAGLLIVNPANWPKVRRAIGTSWLTQPHPTVAVSIAAAPGTAILTGANALHLFREPIAWSSAVNPQQIGEEVAAIRGFYLAIRKAAGVQTITGIPA